MFIRILIVLVAIFGSGALNASAQIFKTLYNFSGTGWPPTNPDGAQPYETGLVLLGDTLYGTTYFGGTNGCGVVFSIKTDGTGYNVLHTFSAASPAPDYTNADGQFPQGTLTLAGDTLYGTTLNGGTVSGGYGVIYSLKTNGNDFTRIHSFDSTTGRNPNGPLIITGGRLFGTAEQGGAGGNGTVFSLNLDGSDYSVLHAFTNADGNFPNGVILSGDTLYGDTAYGGTNGRGTIFSLNTNGENFTVLHRFTDGGAEGNMPWMPPAVSGDRIYCATTFGTEYRGGALLSMKTNGDEVAVLHVFSASGNWDGNGPMGILVTNGVIYGVTESGGDGDSGVMYSVNTDGSHFSVLHSFTPVNFLTQYTNYDGAYPEGPPVLSGNTLYGTAERGGANNGTVFSIVVQPAIASIQLAATNLVLNGFNGIQGENCLTLAAPNVAWPLTNWIPIATNTLPAGDFTITVTNAFDSSASKYFYIFKVQ